MLDILFIAIGGALGAVLRFLVSDWMYLALGRAFPYGTLIVNVIGSPESGSEHDLQHCLVHRRLLGRPDSRQVSVTGRRNKQCWINI